MGGPSILPKNLSIARTGQFTTVTNKPCNAQFKSAVNTSASHHLDGESLLQDILSRLRVPSPETPPHNVRSSLASITYGAAGVSCALHKIAVARKDTELLDQAKAWTQFATTLVNDKRASASESFNTTSGNANNISPYHAASGVHVMRAIVGRACNDSLPYQEAIQAFLSATNNTSGRSLDLTKGRSGILLALSLLANSFENASLLVARGDKLLAEIWQELNRYDPIASCEQMNDLGIAHGWAGLLYLSLRWAQITENKPREEVKSRLDELAEFAMISGRGIDWPVKSRHRSAYSAGWCNGGAGFVYLWTMAHKSYNDSFYLKLAEATAANLAVREPSGSNLCCGAAGQSYALLNIYRHTHDSKWLNYAIHMCERAVQMVMHARRRGENTLPLSLYKGEIGVALLVAELSQPDSSAMPFFE
jgi:lantibiotic modifying enzyme